MADFDFKWHGDDIAQELERATREGLEVTGADFVRTADPNIPVWQGFLRRSNRYDSVDRAADGTLSIEMGSFDIHYAEHQERGTSKMEGKFFFQNSADRTWPKLPDNIKGAMRKPAV